MAGVGSLRGPDLVFCLVRHAPYHEYVFDSNELDGSNAARNSSRCNLPGLWVVLLQRAINGRFVPFRRPHDLRKVPSIDPTVSSGDRILTTPLLTPKRWDLIAFGLPGAPEINYVKRVVGLPGETIEIKAGSIWADGRELKPPENIDGIEYKTEIEFWKGPVWGSTERPAILSDDEYFVLGDFQSRSKDARLWERGAPGRNLMLSPLRRSKESSPISSGQPTVGAFSDEFLPAGTDLSPKQHKRLNSAASPTT